MSREKVMLCYPVGDLWQRGEDRCQSKIDASAATAMRAPNDLGYAASVLMSGGYEVYLRDYQTERLSMEDVEADILCERPSMILLSTTNGSVFDDLRFVHAIKSWTDAKIVLKGAIFWDPPEDMLTLLDLSEVDCIIGGEVEFSIRQVADAFIRQDKLFQDIPNIFYKDEKGSFHKTFFGAWEQDLDSIPFPARQLMKNALYTRPDTGEAMATIQTSRGCPSQCVYCLSPEISGKRLRLRSTTNVMAEIEECYAEHHIRNFFFRADTFTMNAAWVEELCNRIIESPLHGKIHFTANSRVRPLRKETLAVMKKAGCFLVAFGFESGSDETLQRARKGATVEENLQAARWAREVGLPMYGFYLIGFPWETKEHLEATRRLIFKINAEFIEIHIALPYYGTALYQQCKEAGVLKEQVYGTDYFSSSTTGTKFLSYEELARFRSEVMLRYYMRPSYLWHRLGDAARNPAVFVNYARYGVRLVKNLLAKK